MMSYKDAISTLKSGRVIGLPTDTVYGLAADARCDRAVAEIYALKSRPSFNPLIIHVHDLEQAQQYGEFNEDALRLAHHFWVPAKTASALTIVVPYKKSSGISSLALAGLDTIALRVPNHPLALQVFAEFGGPLAAPSANPSNYLSPTTAEHVRTAFSGLPVLDGGPCVIGVESTIVWCQDGRVQLLRPGIVTLEDLTAVILGKSAARDRGSIHYNASRSSQLNSKNDHSRTVNGSSIRDFVPVEDDRPKAPGALKKHYAPKTPMVMDVETPLPGDVYIGFGPNYPSDMNLSKSGDLKEAAANLFRYLHMADQQKAKRIAIAPIPKNGIGQAINDRLSRGTK